LNNNGAQAEIYTRNAMKMDAFIFNNIRIAFRGQEAQNNEKI
jgi:hypothetical protein